MEESVGRCSFGPSAADASREAAPRAAFSGAQTSVAKHGFLGIDAESPASAATAQVEAWTR
jgi:hypothetical protein